MTFLLQIHIRRLETVASHPSLRHFGSLLEKLGPDGMSTDESDVESGPHNSNYRSSYQVLTPLWRSDELTVFLHTLDTVYTHLRKSDPERQRGSWPRVRRYDAQRKVLSQSKRFIHGLPANAYSRDFLAKYSDAEVKVKVAPTEAMVRAFPADVYR